MDITQVLAARRNHFGARDTVPEAVLHHCARSKDADPLEAMQFYGSSMARLTSDIMSTAGSGDDTLNGSIVGTKLARAGRKATRAAAYARPAHPASKPRRCDIPLALARPFRHNALAPAPVGG
jgi:hypothetical protein